MKYLLSILLFSCTIMGISAQCKFDYDKTDPFTKEKEQRINFKVNAIFGMALYHKGDQYRIESYINMPGKQSFIVPVGHKLNVKLANGKVLTLLNTAEAAPKVDATQYEIYSSYAMSYSITAEQYKEIVAGGGIAFIRTWLQEQNYYDYEFKNKETEKTASAAACIVNSN